VPSPIVFVVLKLGISLLLYFGQGDLHVVHKLLEVINVGHHWMVAFLRMIDLFQKVDGVVCVRSDLILDLVEHFVHSNHLIEHHGQGLLCLLVLFSF
jgi:hypothetical protein